MLSCLCSIATVNMMTIRDQLTTTDADECDAIADKMNARIERTLQKAVVECTDIIRNELYSYMAAVDERRETTVQTMTTDVDQHDGMDDELTTDNNTVLMPPPKKRFKEAITTNGKDRQKNVYDTDIPTVPASRPPLLPTPTASRDQLLFCDNSIILFVGEKNESVRTDVTNSLILAQLNADKQMLTFKEKVGKSILATAAMEEWMRVFQETFSHMGWVDTGFEVTKASAAGNNLSVEKVLVDIIESIGNDQEKSTFKKAMVALKGLPQEDERMTLFKRRTMERDFTQFLVHLVYIDGRGSAMMKTSMVCVSTKQTITNVLWFTWNDAGTQVFKAEHNMMLGARAFDLIRPAITQRILKINETYVNSIPF